VLVERPDLVAQVALYALAGAYPAAEVCLKAACAAGSRWT
jgi:hypothetical protein